MEPIVKVRRIAQQFLFDNNNQHGIVSYRRKLYHWDYLITAYHLQKLRAVESAVCCERYVRKILAENGRDILKRIIVHNSLDGLKEVKLKKSNMWDRRSTKESCHSVAIFGEKSESHKFCSECQFCTLIVWSNVSDPHFAPVCMTNVETVAGVIISWTLQIVSNAGPCKFHSSHIATPRFSAPHWTSVTICVSVCYLFCHQLTSSRTLMSGEDKG